MEKTHEIICMKHQPHENPSKGQLVKPKLPQIDKLTQTI